jgi:RNA recognition motif-containing protein
LINLEKQVVPSGNCLNKYLRISGLSQHTTEAHIRKLFKNSTRISDIVIHLGIEYEAILRYAILKFPSHSAARKTLESFHHWDRYRIEWVSVNGEIVGDANFLRQPKQGELKKLLAPLFCCALFARDPENLSFTLPVDKSFHIKDERHDAETPEYLIGNSLSHILSFDIENSPSQLLAD